MQQPCWLLAAQLLAAGAAAQLLLLLDAAAAVASSQQQQQHAYRFMDAGSFMHACQLLLMRACVLRAYCKKCRVHIVLERVGWSNIPVLIWCKKPEANQVPAVSPIRCDRNCRE